MPGRLRGSPYRPYEDVDMIDRPSVNPYARPRPGGGGAPGRRGVVDVRDAHREPEAVDGLSQRFDDRASLVGSRGHRDDHEQVRRLLGERKRRGRKNECLRDDGAHQETEERWA